MTNSLSQGRIHAASAGSHPSGEIHPLTEQFLLELGYSCDGLKCQSWDDFKHYKPNVVLTMCDQAATETCPVWVEETPQVHWGVLDPSKSEGDENQLRANFQNTITEIANRVRKLLLSNIEAVDDQELAQILRSIA